MYANQFTKYDPAEFVEQDVEEFTVTDDGPVMCPEVSRAAMQRSIGKIFYHAGFEEFQPSALETVTDIATDYFQKLGKTLMLYKEAPRHDTDLAPEASGILPSKLTTSHKTDYDRTQEMLLHALYENGADVECLDSYMHDDIERLGTKLHTIHERMKAYLTDLLVSIFHRRHSTRTNGSSVPHLQIPVATTRSCSTTAVNSSWAVTLPKTSATTSSASRNLAWMLSSACLAPQFHSISCKVA